MNLALFTAFWWGLGFPSAWALWRAGGRGLAVGAAPLAGGLALVLPLPVWIASGLPLGLWWLGAIAASTLIGIGVAMALPRDSREPAPRMGVHEFLALCIVLVAAAILILTGLILSNGWPGYGWDGLAIWMLRAKVLAQSSVVPAGVFSEPALVQSHWDYPLAFPALVAWLARGAELGVREYAAALGVIGASLTLATAGIASARFGGPLAAIVALLPWAMPAIARLHFEGYADPMLTLAVVAGACGALTAALSGSAVSAVTAGLALALGVATKNEGALWCASVTGGAWLVAFVSGRSRAGQLRLVLRLATPGAFVFCAWALGRVMLGADSDLATGLRFDAIGDRFGIVITTLLQTLAAGWGGFFGAAAITALVMGAGRTAASRLRRSVVFLSLPALYLAGLVAVYLVTPYDVGWHLATSLPRTLLPVVPLLALLAAFASGLRTESASQAD